MRALILTFAAMCWLPVLLMLSHCADARPVNHGPVATPVASAGVSTTEADLIGSYASAKASGNGKVASASVAAISLTSTVEVNHDLRLIFLAGVVVLALGAAITFEFGKLIGGGVTVLGGALIGAAVVAQPLYQYRDWIALGIILAGLGYELYRHASILTKLKTGALALDHAAALALTSVENHFPFLQHGSAKVKAALATTYDKIVGEAHQLAAKVGVAKAVSAAPIAPSAHVADEPSVAAGMGAP